jgi:hypothetical protein
MSEPQGCCITALLVSILIRVTAIIAKTTWDKDVGVLSKLKCVVIGEVYPRGSREYIIQMTLRSINSNFAECYFARCCDRDYMSQSRPLQRAFVLGPGLSRAARCG